MNSYDTVVVGLGVMGAAATASLAARGCRVLGLEQFWPAHDRGSSHGRSRIVRMAYFEHPDYVPLLQRAYAGWAELEATAGRRLIDWTGALMIGPTDSAVVTGTLASAVRWDLPHELLDRDAMRQRFGEFRLGPDEVAVFERNAGVIDADAAVTALHAAADRRGAELRFECPLDRWELTADGVRVDLDGEHAICRHLVLSAGPWTARVLSGVPAFALTVVRTVSHHVRPLDPAAFGPEHFPAFVWEVGERDALYGLADIGAGAPKVGFHHRHSPADPATVDRAVTGEELAAMREVLAVRIPGLAGGDVVSKVCMYTLTPDDHFVIGNVPGTDGRVSVAAGFSGHGFKFGPVVGEILADLALDGGTDAPIALFDPQRF